MDNFCSEMYANGVAHHRSTSMRLTRSLSGAKKRNTTSENSASDRLVELLTKIIVAVIISENTRAETIFVLPSRVSMKTECYEHVLHPTDFFASTSVLLQAARQTKSSSIRLH
jgi:hypothetical protein